MSFNLDDYVDVAERITKFYEKYPDGRIRRDGEPEVKQVGDKLFIMYKALAYRTPDDSLPAPGCAWEPFPGPTQFTRDSELMNAETAAWGRAIVAAGIGAKKIASRDEIESRRANGGDEKKPGRKKDVERTGKSDVTPTPMSREQYELLKEEFALAGNPEAEVDGWLKVNAKDAIGETLAARIASLSEQEGHQLALFLSKMEAAA